MPALVGLSTFLGRTEGESFDASNAVDCDYSVRGGGHLSTYSPPLTRTPRIRRHAMFGGYAMPMWASWLEASRPLDAAEVVPVPNLLADTGLAVPPGLPWLEEYVFTMLGDASHRAWTVVMTEWVADLAAAWLSRLRDEHTLVRLQPDVLQEFARLPLDDLQVQSPDGAALAFSRCVAGARLYPWSAVTRYVVAGRIVMSGR